MCWVMPPASPAATSVVRIASSNEVLPWSTWPMIVTTGGRSTRSSSASSNVGSTSTSSAAWTISIFFSNSSASTWIASSDSVCVSVAISPRVISFLITSGTGTPRYSATSLTVEPELTRTSSVASIAVLSIGAIVSSYVPRRRRPRRGRRWGWLAGPPCWRREACESITTRRRPPGPMSPGVRSPVRESRVGRTRSPPGPVAWPAAGAAGAVEALGAAGVAGACPAGAAAAGVAAAGVGALGACAEVAAGAGVGVAGLTAGGGALAAGFAAAGAGAAALPFVLAGPPSAFSATASSTDEAAAFASIPAARSFSSSSLLERPCSLAISCTRFLLMGSPILRAWRHSARARQESRGAARGRSRHGAQPARDSLQLDVRHPRRGTDRRRDQASARAGRRRRGRAPSCSVALRQPAAAPTSARSVHNRRSGAGERERLWRRLLGDLVGDGLLDRCDLDDRLLGRRLIDRLTCE